jgi:hypothetical protein
MEIGEMKKETLTVKGYMGQALTVTGEIDSGLLLYKRGKTWVILHLGTGCTIGPGDHLKKDAIARLARLLDLLPDWTGESMEDLARKKGMSPGEFAGAVRAVAY